MTKFVDFNYLSTVVSENFRVYLDAQFQIESRIYRTLTEIGISSKGESVHSEEDNSFYPHEQYI